MTGFLSGLRLRARLGVLVALTVFSLAAAGLISARMIDRQLVEDRTELLRAIVEGAGGIADSLAKDVAAGTLTRDAALSAFQRAVMGFRYGENDYIFAYAPDGTTIAHANAKFLNTIRIDVPTKDGRFLVREMLDGVKATGSVVIRYDFPRPGSEDPAPKMSYAAFNRSLGILIGTGVYVDDLDAKFRPIAWTLAATVVAIAVLTTAAAALIGRSITRPLGSLESRMRRLADGDLDGTIEEAARLDEIGAMGRAVQVFQTSAQAKRQLEAEQAAAARRAEAERQATLHRLAESFQSTVGSVITALTEQAGGMEAQARTMMTAAETTNEQAAAAAVATRQTSANVEEVAAASQQLSSTIAEISRQVSDSGRIAGEAVTLAQNANTKVGGLAEAVQRIGTVVELINNIASQTNLLALNATIEAARAGEAGKGFAVVASEVKALANQTAKATEEIASQVAGIQEATGEAVGEIRSVVGVIEQVNGIAATIASAVEEQGAATAEIARNVQEAARGARDAAASIGSVNDAAGASGLAARSIMDRAKDLAGRTGDLNREVAGFLNTVRAA